METDEQFPRQLAESWLPIDIFERIMEKKFGRVQVQKGTFEEDLSGVDYWVNTPFFHRPVGVDTKRRTGNYYVQGKYHRRDMFWESRDVLLEIYSNIYPNGYTTTGWAVNDEKKSDYLLWYWPDVVRPKHMHLLADTAQIRAWTKLHWKEYDLQTTKNGENLSGYIIVPAKDLLKGY